MVGVVACPAVQHMMGSRAQYFRSVNVIGTHYIAGFDIRLQRNVADTSCWWQDLTNTMCLQHRWIDEIVTIVRSWFNAANTASELTCIIYALCLNVGEFL
jgi:hypothetical protein